jgi:hypothetical protein
VVGAVSAWDRAVTEFGVAWQLSARERTALRLTISAPTRGLERRIRELLVETAGLALETGRSDVAAWCYATCELVTDEVGSRPTLDDIGTDRCLIEGVSAAVPSGASGESLVWWCVRLMPRQRDETPEAARRRTTQSAFYLAARVMQGFTSEDAVSRERAGLIAAFAVVIARQLRLVWSPVDAP